MSVRCSNNKFSGLIIKGRRFPSSNFPPTYASTFFTYNYLFLISFVDSALRLKCASVSSESSERANGWTNEHTNERTNDVLQAVY